MDFFRLFPVPGSTSDNRYDLGAYTEYGRSTDLYHEYIGKIKTSIGQDIHEFYTDETKSSKVYVVSDEESITIKAKKLKTQQIQISVCTRPIQAPSIRKNMWEAMRMNSFGRPIKARALVTHILIKDATIRIF